MMVITMAKLRMAHARTHGARKPPGPIIEEFKLDGVKMNLHKQKTYTYIKGV